MSQTDSRSLIRKFLALLCSFSLTLLLLSGCSAAAPLRPNDKAFSEFTSMLFRQEVASSTISLHYTLQNPADYGLTDSPVTYGNISADNKAAYAALENCSAALHRYSPSQLSSDNKLTYEVLDAYFQAASASAPYLLYAEPLSPYTGIHTQLPILLSEYQFYSAEDVSVYLKLLEETKEYFDSLFAFEKSKSDAGLFMTDDALDSVQKQCQAFIDMGDTNYLFTTFDERIHTLSNLSEQEQARLSAQNKTCLTSCVFPAYEQLIKNLESLRGTGINKKGLCFFENGKDYYQSIVTQNTGTKEPVSKLQQMAKSQIADDLKAIDELLFPTASTPTLSALENVPPLSMLNDLKNKIDDNFPTIPTVNVQVKYVPDAMEPFLSPAFYMIPAIDNASDNVIYINQGQTVNELNLYTTLAHEGYPGHLYQTVYYASKDTDPVRSILDFGGYVEGWATYAEMMSYYLAPISKNEAVLLQKNNSVILGLYALADMGIHYDGWSRMDTFRFFKDYGISDVTVTNSIYDLILGTPGNYLKYYIGYVKFLNLKKEIAKELGDSFSQKDFHRAVLDVGPAPFDIVESYVKKELID